jgi:hypothetical protein
MRLSVLSPSDPLEVATWPDLPILCGVNSSLSGTYTYLTLLLDRLKESGDTVTIALTAPWSANIDSYTPTFDLFHECAHLSFVDAKAGIAPGQPPASYWSGLANCDYYTPRSPWLPEIQCDPLEPRWRAYRGDNPDAPNVELQEMIKAAAERPMDTYIWVLLSNARALALAEIARQACLALMVLGRVVANVVVVGAWTGPTSVVAIIRTLMSHRHRHEPADGRLLSEPSYSTRWRVAIVR